MLEVPARWAQRKTDRNPSLSLVRSETRPETQTWTGAQSARRWRARLSWRRNRKRGDQGVDALHYTERTGTASNRSGRCWSVGCSPADNGQWPAV